LKALGWVDGRNLRIEQRFAGGDPDRIQAMAAELTALSPDLILGSGAPVTTALRSATPTIPIVFVQVSDPVGAGIVPSLSRPEGNVTGFTNFEYNMVGKWLDLLRQLAPGIVRVLMIQNPANFGWPGYVRALEASAPTFGLQPHLAPVRTPSEIEEAISNFAREPEGGMVVLPDTTTGVNRKLIVGLAQRHRIPAVYPFRFFVADGGLMSYGLKVPDVFRQAASYIDRILRGEQPSKLPVQAPTTFELVLHPKAAGALGLTFPLSLLARADEVIE
jgi:putative tryptophan/tyrosine transport system substrate-binding protein